MLAKNSPAISASWYRVVSAELGRLRRVQGRGVEKPANAAGTPQNESALSVLITESYVQEFDGRLGLYRRLADVVAGLTRLRLVPR